MRLNDSYLDCLEKMIRHRYHSINKRRNFFFVFFVKSELVYHMYPYTPP